MAEALKVLGQADPAATTLTALYTVPGATSAVASSLTIANRTGSTKTVRVSVAIAGAGDAVEQYIIYDVKILKNDFMTLTLGITLAATDVVRVYVDALGVSFNLFGTEVT